MQAFLLCPLSLRGALCRGDPTVLKRCHWRYCELTRTVMRHRSVPGSYSQTTLTFLPIVLQQLWKEITGSRKSDGLNHDDFFVFEHKQYTKFHTDKTICLSDTNELLTDHPSAATTHCTTDHGPTDNMSHVIKEIKAH